MQRQAFISLLHRYLDDTCTPAEKEVMDSWYDLLDEEFDEKIDGVSRGELEQALWARIRDKISPDETLLLSKQQRSWWQRQPLYWAAASILLAFGLFFFMQSAGSLPEQIADSTKEMPLPTLQEEHNTGSRSRWFTLEDSTRVLLEPESSIRYATPMPPELRSVHLAGDAFFDVAKDKQRPFVVRSGDIVTTVVGTSFSVRSEGDNLEVSVATGRVVVEKAAKEQSGSSRRDTDGVVLTPNQKVTYFARDRHFVTGLVENPLPIVVPSPAAEEQLFRFEGVPLDQVLARIEDVYGVEVVLMNESIHTCPVTADLSKQPLYTKLEIICAALQTTFKVKGTNIILSGGNCE